MDEGFGFPTSRTSSCGRHAWNLKILSNNPGSVLRCMGPVMGVTVPTLHVGMVFTTGCWYRDPHGLPWVEYHHNGAPKIWYSVPDSQGIAFYTAMKQLVPTFCKKRKIWLPADTTMVMKTLNPLKLFFNQMISNRQVPPNLLVKYGVSVSRTIQEPGQFLVVFPKSYTSYVCSGYSVAESVYYAPGDYLDYAETEFQNIRDSCEPMMFPLSKLLICIAQHEETSKATLRLVKPHLERIRDNEYIKRTIISDMGVKGSERIVLKSKKHQEQDDEYECEICSENLYISYVSHIYCDFLNPCNLRITFQLQVCDLKEDTYYCLNHAVEYLQERKASQRKHCKLLYTHSKDEISGIVKMVNSRIQDSESSSSSSDEEEIEVKRYFEKKKAPSASSAAAAANPASASALAMAAAAVAAASSKGKVAAAKKKPPPREMESPSPPPPPPKKEKPAKKPPQKTPPKEAAKEAKKKRSKEAEAPSAKRKKKQSEEEDDDDIQVVDDDSEEEERPKKKAKKSAPSAASSSRSTAASASTSAAGRRKTKTRKAALDKSGNLAVEYLDMLLSESESGEDAEEESDSSEEGWK